MGGQSGSQMGAAATPQTNPTPGFGAQPGGFDLSKLFMGNTATNQPGGGQQLPQIMAPPRQPMPVMPQRAPMPMPQAPAQSPAMNMREAMLTSWKNYNQLNPVERSRMRHPNR